jgi:hypothetical protein
MDLVQAPHEFPQNLIQVFDVDKLLPLSLQFDQSFFWPKWFPAKVEYVLLKYMY